MEATDLAAKLGVCVYISRVLYCSDIFLETALQ